MMADLQAKRRASTLSYVGWILAAVILYPLLFIFLFLVVIMPPLNLFLVPVFFFVIVGAIGTIQNGIADAGAERDKLSRRI